ncbi:Glutaminase kidney mitochondrial [Fasciola hepatica]|uniref:glutaminase n=1 Tax=Fasciola hepatica TaxID=6192 RepID=A0A4E0RR99_FASHE|nr:Glutaminase kidney mitochondrial [Fasciola hepatica]
MAFRRGVQVQSTIVFSRCLWGNCVPARAIASGSWKSNKKWGFHRTQLLCSTVSDSSTSLIVKNFRSPYQTSIVDSLFDSVKHTDADLVDSSELLDLISRAGISLDDPRLSKFMEKLKKLHGLKVGQKLVHRTHSLMLDREAFKTVAQENVQMLMRVVTNDFCIPDFQRFASVIEELYHVCQENEGGKLASYIPQLERVDPSLWGVAVCTVDGQRLSIGDSSHNFTLQSSSKPLTYALALTELGPEVVHQYVGYEPSGLAFNQITLNPQKRPHNPLINAGALAICSILQPHLSPPERFRYVENKFSQLAGGQTLGFNNAVFLSERASADRNFAIAYYMQENRCFPEQTSLRNLVDFYLQICSIEGNCDAVAVMASSLANGGINPLTGARLLSAGAARDTLSVMHSCGMYDYSGQFAFKVGLPCKSGVSGVILAVVPNLMGIALYSPLIDRHGNSVRGVQFCQDLVQRFIFHHYESQLHTDKKFDPRKPRDAYRTDAIASLLFAAENNDLAMLRRSYISGVDFTSVDYDGRTGLHVAASSGSLDAVRFFIEVGGVNPNPVDRWGHTPLTEAKHFNHAAVVEYLEHVLQNQSE